MIHPGGRIALFLLTLTAAAGGGYALASQGTATNRDGPKVSCRSPFQLPTVYGRAPAGVTTVYLAYSDGASIEAAVVHRSYMFRLPPPGPATAWPDQLRYTDNSGRQHAVLLARAAFARCVSTPRAAHAATEQRPQTTEDQAGALVNQARELAFRTSHACGQQSIPPTHLTLSNGSPSTAMLRVLGVLRRPATAEEIAASRTSNFRLEPEPAAVLTIFRRYVRIVRWSSGVTARIIVGSGEESLPKTALYPCMNAATRILTSLLPGHPPAVQREALRSQHSYKLGPQTHGFHPWLDYQGAGGTSGPFDTAVFRKGGIFIEGGGMAPPPGTNPRASGALAHPKYHWQIGGLVPDGVATITLQLSGKNPHMGAFGRPGEPGLQGFAHPYTATVHVRDNTFFFDLPADANSAAHQRMIWHTADGRPIRTVHYP